MFILVFDVIVQPQQLHTQEFSLQFFSILAHFSESEVFAPSESRRQPNRRIDYDEDIYDYDVNAFDNQDMDLYYKCKQKALMRGRSLKNNEDMPSFKHFPKKEHIFKNR